MGDWQHLIEVLSSKPEVNSVSKPKNLACLLKLWSDLLAQDLIEYALMAGFVAVAAGAAFPPVANSLSQIFSRVTSVLSSLGGS